MFVSLSVKIQGHSYRFDTLNPNVTKKLSYHPPMLGEGINFKKYVYNKEGNV